MKKTWIPAFALLMLATLVLTIGCSQRDPAGLEVARAPVDPVVYSDGILFDPYFQAFSGTYHEAVGVDSSAAYDGSSSLMVTVPGEGSSLGGYAGGVLTSVAVRDFADFNAMTFYARSSVPTTLDVVGYGNDNTGNSRFEAGRNGISLTENWTFVVVPVPAPSKLLAVRGLFTFAEGFEYAHRDGHTLWFDEIRFAKLGNITDPRPTIPSVDRQYFVGSKASLAGTSTTYSIDGDDVVVDHMPSYFDFNATDPGVAEVENAEVTIVGEGSTTINATLEGVPVEGDLVLHGFMPPASPAPAPEYPADGVISMYCDQYGDDVTVESWNPHWQYSNAEEDLFTIDGDEAMVYSGLNFVGIVFDGYTINATDKTHLHLDVFAPFGTDFLVKVVVFNQNNGYAIGNAELRFDETTTPSFVAGQWSSLDIPLEDFGLTASWEFVGQLVLSTADAELVLIDNVLWHD